MKIQRLIGFTNIIGRFQTEIQGILRGYMSIEFTVKVTTIHTSKNVPSPPAMTMPSILGSRY